MNNNSSRIQILAWSIIGILLSMMAVYPLGFDQAIFEVGGAMIVKQGAIPFRDYIELKQPLIFYIYSLSTLLFGRHEYSIRLLDILYHIGSLIVLYKLVTKYYTNRSIALLSVVCYAVYYVSTGFWMTAEVESFALLPQLIIAWILLQDNDSLGKQLRSAVFIAFNIIVLIWMKMTLGLIAMAVILFYLMEPGATQRKRIVCTLSLSASLAIGLVFSMLLLQAFSAWENTVLSFKWLSNYALYYPLLSVDTYKTFYSKIFIWQTVSSFTPTIITLVLITLIRQPLKLFGSERPVDQKERFRLFCFLGMMVSVLGVMIERKGFNYHFIRGAWYLMPFAAESIVFIYQWSARQMRTYLRPFTLTSLTFLGSTVALGGIAFLFSPLPRLVDQPFSWVKISLSHNEQAKNEKLKSYKYDVEEMQHIVSTYKGQLAPEDNIFLWGNSAQLYYYFDRLPTTISIVNIVFVTGATPEKWNNELVSGLQKRPPKLFICEYNDERPLISGSVEDSYTILTKNKPIFEFLSSSYTLVESTAHFKIFMRKEIAG